MICMICLCNNWFVFSLGSRIELGAKTDKLIKMCVSIVFCCFCFFLVLVQKY